MRTILSFLFTCVLFLAHAQKDVPTDYLSSEFHKSRREALRKMMPKNSVAVFFSNPVRNRANDVDFQYHQDPDFCYLTTYTEPHTVLMIFSDDQQGNSGAKYNEIVFAQSRDPQSEMRNGRRLGPDGVREKLGFATVIDHEQVAPCFPLSFSIFRKKFIPL